MKRLNRLVLGLMLLTVTFMITSCWNYREIDELSIVSGVAIDKGKASHYKLTVEVVQIKGDKEAETTPKLIEVEGRTMFDTVRNGISLSGKKLYWSHNKVVIISEEVARQGVLPILDWFNRDAETRADFQVLIAKGQPAGKVFTGQGTTENIQSYELNDMIRNQENLSKAPQTHIWQFNNYLQNKAISAIAPTITVKGGKTKRPFIQGTALFKSDRLIGFLDGEETEDMLFVKNEIKGGVLAFEKVGKTNKTPVSLEIFKNKTDLKPRFSKGQILMAINTDTVVAIDEIGGTENLIDEPMVTHLEQEAANKLETRIKHTVRKVQTQYGLDPFGFGVKLQQDYPQVWEQIAGRWPETYRNIKVDVKSTIQIRNSATMSKPLKIGD